MRTHLAPAKTAFRVFAKNVLPLCLGLTLVAANESTQLNESSLIRSYGRPTNNTFTLRPKLKLKADYGPKHEVCTLTLFGATSEREVSEVFDTAVPEDIRGKKEHEFIECAGLCQRMVEYEKVRLLSGIVGRVQVSEPAAFIIVKSNECASAAKRAEQVTFHATLLDDRN